MNYYQNYLTPQQYYQPQNAYQNNQNIFGKIVDGKDVVKALDVPLGGYGIFPKGDLTEIYLKTWNNDGTTSIRTYSLAQDKEDDLSKRVATLENQLNELLAKKVNTNEF